MRNTVANTVGSYQHYYNSGSAVKRFQSFVVSIRGALMFLYFHLSNNRSGNPEIKTIQGTLKETILMMLGSCLDKGIHYVNPFVVHRWK